MAFLRSATPVDSGPVIYGEGVFLRTPQMNDHTAWASLRDNSRKFLSPWEPTWPMDDLTRSAFRRRVKRYLRDVREDTAYPFFIFRTSDMELLGGLTLSHIARGVTQTCSLGYWIGEPHAAQGYMSAAVRTVVPFVFETLRLHRIEAACIPGNDPSVALLEKTGFQKEGVARRYLKINGLWQDHLLFALLEDDPRM